jgi:hypothetical protein
VALDQLDSKELKVQLVLRDHKVSKELLQLVCKVLRVLQVQLDSKELKVQLVLRDHKALKELHHPEHKDQQVQLDSKVHKEVLVQLVFKELRDHKVFLPLVFKEQLVFKV